MCFSIDASAGSPGFVDGLFKLSQFGQAAVTIAALLLAAYVLFRSRTPGILREELTIVRDRCKRLEAENMQLSNDIHIRDLVITDLKAKTDLTDIRGSLKQISESLQVLLTERQRHEERHKQKPETLV